MGYISELRETDQVQHVLGDIFALSHRMDSILVPHIHPVLMHLDVPAEDALPEYLPDGHPIYPGDRRLFHSLRRQMLAKYYQTYYAAITKVMESGGIKAGVDCHVFSATSITQEAAKPSRSIICLSNNGDALGGSGFSQGPLTCPQDMLCDLRDIVTAKFSDFVERGQVLLNTPISGGHLIRVQAQQKIPWIRIDIAKELFLNAEGGISAKRVERLKDHFENILVLFCKVYEWM